MPETFPGFTDDNLSEINKQSRLFWERATTAHEQFFLNVNDWEQMAHCKLPRAIADAYAPYDDRSALAPHDIYVNMASLVSAIYNLTFSQKPYGRLSIFGEPGVRSNPAVLKAEAVLQQMNDVGQEDHVSSRVIHQALYAGITCTFTRWTHKIVRQVRRDDEMRWIIDRQGRPIYQEERIASYGETVPIDIRRVRIDPSCDLISDRKIVGHHTIMSLSELLKKNKHENHFYNFDEQELRDSTFDHEKYYEYAIDETDAYSEKGRENLDFGDKIVEVRQIRGIYRVTRGNSVEYEDLIVHIANTEILLGVTPNDLPIAGYDMYQFPTVDQEHGRLFPMGVVEPAQDMWVYLFMLLNNKLDRSNRETYDMYLADGSALQSMSENIQFIGGQIIKIDTMGAGLARVSDAFTPLQKSPTTDSSFQLIAMVQNMIQQVMKLSDYQQGIDPGRAETATAVDALIQGGRSLLMHLVDNLKHTFWAPVWQQKLILHNHFKGHESNQIVGRDGQKFDISPGELNMLWQIDIDTQGNQSRPAAVRRLVEMFPILQQSPYVEQRELVETVVEILELPNRDRLLVDDELQAFIIDRENIALSQNVPQPVHPMDRHQAHIESHSQMDPMTREGQGHIEAHQLEIEKQNKGQLANSKELGGGTGDLVNAQSAAITHTTGQGAKPSA